MAYDDIPTDALPAHIRAADDAADAAFDDGKKAQGRSLRNLAYGLARELERRKVEARAKQNKK